jgi:hypothetical protein
MLGFSVGVDIWSCLTLHFLPGAWGISWLLPKGRGARVTGRSFKTSGGLLSNLRQPIINSNVTNGISYISTFRMIQTLATSSPVGSEVFSALALLVISLSVLLLLRHYLPLRTTPAYLLVPIFFALSLPASIILLVPIDLASNARDEDAGSRGIWLPDRLLLVSWRISYWLTFALMWYVDELTLLIIWSKDYLGSFFLSLPSTPTLDTESPKDALYTPCDQMHSIRLLCSDAVLSV